MMKKLIQKVKIIKAKNIIAVMKTKKIMLKHQVIMKLLDNLPILKRNR